MSVFTAFWNMGRAAALARGDCPRARRRRVVLLLAAIWVLNAFDLGFTLFAHRFGYFTELNPVAAQILDSTHLLALYKFGLLVAGSVILIAVSRHAVAELGCWLLLVCYFYVACRWYVYYAELLRYLTVLWR